MLRARAPGATRLVFLFIYYKAEYVQQSVPSNNVQVLFVFEVVLIVEVHLNF